MTFRDWIAQMSQAVVAEKLGVSRGAVCRWASGTYIPKPEMMQRIVKLSKGAVTYEAIVTTPKRAK